MWVRSKRGDVSAAGALGATQFRRLWLLLWALAVGSPLGCDDDGDDQDTDVISDDLGDEVAEDASTDADGVFDSPEEPSELVPPNFRDIRAIIEGELGSEVEDLNRGDVTLVIPGEATAGFRIFVDDNETATADLVVRVVDGDPPAEIAGQTVEFRNGLWLLEVTIGPGLSLRVSARDEAGNVALSDSRLVLPTQAEAVVGDWETRFYAVGQVIDHTWTSAFLEDGSWSEQRLDTGDSRGGTWAVVEGRLRVAERYYTDADGPDETDIDTIERELVSRFHVDDLYFSDAPYARPGGGADLVGTWERSIDIHEPMEGRLQLVESRTERLVLGGDDAWTETWTGTRYEGSIETPISRSWSGTYTVERNDDYTENIGDFLIRAVTHVDEVPVSDEPDRFELYAIRAGRLLVTPRLRL